MYFTRLTVRCFRNYLEENLAFHARVNCLVGRNAQGKTNLLEAVYVLARGRSFRIADYHQLIRLESEAALISGVVQCDGISHEVAVELGAERKRWLIDGKRLAGRERWRPGVVLFAPEEVLLFKEGPSTRREFIDRVAEMGNPVHADVVTRYERVVSQRNRLLKEMGSRAITDRLLDPWNQELLQWGCRLFLGRHAAVISLNTHLPEAYRRMASDDPAARLCYQPHCGIETVEAGAEAIAAWFTRTLAARELDEAQRQTTLVGPHRDDITATVGGHDLRDFGSQGQHRSLVLAIKIAEGELYRQRTGEMPVFLLDDVTSELDPFRTTAFFQYLAEMRGQVLWTTMDPKAIPDGSIDRVFTVESGAAREE